MWCCMCAKHCATMSRRFLAFAPAPEYSVDQSSSDWARMVCCTIATASSNRWRASSFDGGFESLKFARAIADVAGVRDLRADVIVQIAGEMQDKKAEAVSVGIRLLPELFVAERGRQFADAGGVGGVASVRTEARVEWRSGIFAPSNEKQNAAGLCPAGQPGAAVPT